MPALIVGIRGLWEYVRRCQLFRLTVSDPPVKTGSIIPDEQMMFVSPQTIQILADGQPVYTLSALDFDPGLYADLSVLDANGNPIHTHRFIAAVFLAGQLVARGHRANVSGRLAVEPGV